MFSTGYWSGSQAVELDNWLSTKITLVY